MIERVVSYSIPLFWLVGLFLAMSILGSCGEDQTQVEEDISDKPWNLVFEDEFDTGFEQWNVWEGGAFNEEIQYYRPAQLSISEGLLTIQAVREPVTGPTHPWDNTLKTFEYASGRIESKTLFGPSSSDGENQYRFEARLQLPSGTGMWPAFWTYGDPWPTQGEIDILEARGQTPEAFQSNLFYGNEANVNINSGNEMVYRPGPDLTAGFHVYEMIWKQNSIDVLFDGELLHTYEASASNNIENMFGKRQKIVLNTAVGGLFFSDRDASSYADSSVFKIDWVRVYKR